MVTRITKRITPNDYRNILSYILYFDKWKCAYAITMQPEYLCISCPSTSEKPEPIFMKVSPISLCVFICIPLLLLCNGSLEMDTRPTLKDLLKALISMRFVSYEEKYAIISFQNIFLCTSEHVWVLIIIIIIQIVYLPNISDQILRKPFSLSSDSQIRTF